MIEAHSVLALQLELDEKVDVIVSEWMGFHLLHEAMLESVLVARDKFLKKDPSALVLPRYATCAAAPVEMNDFCEKEFSFWQDVYGVDMSCFIPQVVQEALQKPQVHQHLIKISSQRLHCEVKQ